MLDDWTWLRSKFGTKALDSSEHLEAQSQDELSAQVAVLDEMEARQFVKKCFNSDGSECEELSRKVNLLDPITLQRIAIPVRSKECNHIQCFDLRTHLLNNFHSEKTYRKFNLEKSPKAIAVAKRLWRCPICSARASRALLQIDSFTKRVIGETAVATARVLMYPSGKYTAYVDPEENEDNKKQPAKELKDQPKDKDADEIDLTLSDDEAPARKAQKVQDTPRAAGPGKPDPRKRQDTPRPPTKPGDQPAPSGPSAQTAAPTVPTVPAVPAIPAVPAAVATVSAAGVAGKSVGQQPAGQQLVGKPGVGQKAPPAAKPTSPAVPIQKPADTRAQSNSAAASVEKENVTRDGGPIDRTLTAAEALVVIGNEKISDSETTSWLKRHTAFEPDFLLGRDSSSRVLTVAAGLGKLETIQFLVKQGGDSKVAHDLGLDALTAALLKGHFEVCYFFTSQMGIDINSVKTSDAKDANKLMDFISYRLARTLPPAPVAGKSTKEAENAKGKASEISPSQPSADSGKTDPEPEQASRGTESKPIKPHIYADGSEYIGEWKNGLAHGRGKRTWEEGKNYYDGEWTGGKMHGYGKRVWSSGAVYQGCVYDGEWVEGARCGPGRAVYANGETAGGIWQYDKLVQVYCQACGASFAENKWKGHKCNGKPICAHEGPRWDLNRPGFHPEFQELSRECKAHEISTSGTRDMVLLRLKAHFMWHDVQDEKKQAEGSSRTGAHEAEAKGHAQRKDDRPLSGISKYTFTDQSEYHGFWKNHKRHGQGKLTLVNGDSYEGQWMDDKPSLAGKYCWSDGVIYDVRES